MGDGLRDGEAESGAFAARFDLFEAFEDAGAVGGGHSGAGVGDGDRRVGACVDGDVHDTACG